jgi:uncharacterized protein (DUF427 family)
MNDVSPQDLSAPGYAKHPDYRVELLDCAKRVRAVLSGETLADSTRTLLMRETGITPVYYFPRADVRLDLMERTDHATFCPFKGEASYWTLAAGGKRAENAAWSYEAPYREALGIKDRVAFYWDRMDRWLEEDEKVLVHARDPLVRIDVLESRRPVRVVVGGETVAESQRARFLFETGLPPRYYIPAEDLRADLLVPSETRTACPYKGTAYYYSLRVAGRLYEDLVWTYPDPLPESYRIKDRLCFFNEKADAIFVDGTEVPKPKTKWS